MDEIKKAFEEFLEFVYCEGIVLTHLEAIHDKARRNKTLLGCRYFEEWYAENVYSDEDED